MNFPEDYKFPQTEIYTPKAIKARKWFLRNFCAKGKKSSSIRFIASAVMIKARKEVEDYAKRNRLSINEINKHKLVNSILGEK